MVKPKKETKKYNEQSYYWGYISEAEAEQGLKGCEAGRFLVRSHYSSQATSVWLCFVSIVREKPKVVHRAITPIGKQFVLDGKQDKCSAIHEVVCFYQDHVIGNGHKLAKGVPRPTWFLRNCHIKVEQNATVLGGGNFSTVVMGKYRNQDVAVKKLISSEDKILKEKEDLMKEARTMALLKHPYIIKFHGVSIDTMPPMILMELMAGGLLSHLKEEGPKIEKGEKVLYCWQLASALAFVAEKKMVHRDIAARNCLFNVYGILKLTDFGLSDTETNLIAYCTSNDQMPVRWMAPEATLPTATFNEKTDVWSFAVVCGEIFGNGTEPLSHFSDNKDIMEALLKAMKIPPQPNELHRSCPETPPEVAINQKNCWEIDQNLRPTFSDLAQRFDKLLKNMYPPPLLEDMSTSKMKRVKPLTIAEYELLNKYHLDSENDDYFDDDDEAMSTPAQRRKMNRKQK